MIRKKLIYVISNLDNSLGFEWLAENLDRDQLDVFFILLNPAASPLGVAIRKLGYNVEEWNYNGKRDLPRVVRDLIRLFKKENPHIVHAHLFDAALAAMFAAWVVGIKQRVYTRHHADYHQKYHSHAVKYDKMINRFSTHIVAISENVKKILMDQESVPEKKISIIHHGFVLESFMHVNEKAVIALSSKYNPNKRKPVIGVISRYIHWKGLQYIIPAFKELLIEFPNAMLILANARGDYKNEVASMLRDLPDDSYVEIEFEQDVCSLYHLFDVYVHTPIDRVSEAFGQTYIEALAAGIPSVFTISGIAADFILDGKNAVVVEHENANQITDGITHILKCQDGMKGMIARGRQDVSDLFGLHSMMEATHQLYR